MMISFIFCGGGAAEGHVHSDVRFAFKLKICSSFNVWFGGLVAKSCPTLCDCMDCSPPGSSVHGIFQARMLEWIAISFSILMCYFNYVTESDNCGLIWVWVFFPLENRIIMFIVKRLLNVPLTD